MRRRASLVVILAFGVTASTAYAASPGVVYSDFAQDGKLSCGYSRSDLEAALRSGTLNQYGDPMTLAGMKLAVRKQLAGGCKRSSGSGAAAGSSTTTGTTTTQGRGGGGASEHPKSKSGQPSQRSSQPGLSSVQHAGPASESNGSFLAGRGLVIGLLAAAVALGGWLMKHALSTRR